MLFRKFLEAGTLDILSKQKRALRYAKLVYTFKKYLQTLYAYCFCTRADCSKKGYLQWKSCGRNEQKPGWTMGWPESPWCRPWRRACNFGIFGIEVTPWLTIEWVLASRCRACNLEILGRPLVIGSRLPAGSEGGATSINFQRMRWRPWSKRWFKKSSTKNRNDNLWIQYII